MKIDFLVHGDPTFAPYLIHESHHWKLYLNAKDQRYLGRSYLWLQGRHLDNMPFDALRAREHSDLVAFIKRYRKALETLGWSPSLINLAWLGNEVHLHRGHGHLHLVPRYQRTPSLAGIHFPDMNWGRDYQPGERLGLADNLLFQIRDAIKSAISKTRRQRS